MYARNWETLSAVVCYCSCWRSIAKEGLLVCENWKIGIHQVIYIKGCAKTNEFRDENELHTGIKIELNALFVERF